MRREFVSSLSQLADDPQLVFLTGDLGYLAFEGLRDLLGSRFINAGVAEQNMVGVAAGLASEGYRPWVYSIAPFLYARAYEQIRNDVLAHRLPVKFVGNGGGFGYGVMGPTHLGFDDLAVVSSLEGLNVYAPVFASDVPDVVREAANSSAPSYIRLATSPNSAGGPNHDSFQTWRRLIDGEKGVVVVTGSLLDSIWEEVHEIPAVNRPSVWVVGRFPVRASNLPPGLLDDLERSNRLLVLEEHQYFGGIGMQISAALADAGVGVEISWKGSGTGLYSSYGSSSYLRNHFGINRETLMRWLDG